MALMRVKIRNSIRWVIVSTILFIVLGTVVASLWRHQQISLHRTKFAEIERYVMDEMWGMESDDPRLIENPMAEFDYHLNKLVQLGAVQKVEYRFPSINYDEPKRGKLWEDIANEQIPPCLNFKPRKTPGTTELTLTVWCERDIERSWDSYASDIDPAAWKMP